MERRQATEIRGVWATCLETVCYDQRRMLGGLISEFQVQLVSQSEGVLAALRSGTDGETARAKHEHVVGKQRVQELQDTLATTQRLTDLGEAVISLVHEVNQPLTAIGLYAAGCRHLAALGRYEELDAVLMKIADQSERACQVAHQIRGLVQVSATSTNQPIWPSSPVAD